MQPTRYGALVCDGREDAEGRALFLISALHVCHEALRDVEVRFVDVEADAVKIAIETLHWETGLTLTQVPPDAAIDFWVGAAVFCSVVLQECCSRYLKGALARGIPLLVARQFPVKGNTCASDLAMVRAAHDPAIYAEHLVRTLGGRGKVFAL